MMFYTTLFCTLTYLFKWHNIFLFFSFNDQVYVALNFFLWLWEKILLLSFLVGLGLKRITKGQPKTHYYQKETLKKYCSNCENIHFYLDLKAFLNLMLLNVFTIALLCKQEYGIMSSSATEKKEMIDIFWIPIQNFKLIWV